jgi:metal-responsive CopG/Arc/MetJ family transcriptional regulator
MATTIPRFLVHLPTDVQEAVEDFRFSRRMESRSAAIRELIKLGLEVADKRMPPRRKGGGPIILPGRKA